MLGFGKGKTDNFDLFISSRKSLRNENKHTKSVALWVCEELSSVKGSYSGKVQLPGHRMAKVNYGGTGCW